MLVERSGMSILAIDPGGTTGVALYDCWDDKLYVDQLDAGRGRIAKAHIWPGVVESWVKRKVEKHLEAVDVLGPAYGDLSRGEAKKATSRVNAGLGRGKGRKGEQEVYYEVERGVVTLLENLALAMGPSGIVVVEDFILGWGDPSKVSSSAREGLAPVRIANRLEDRFHQHGLWNGDAWRVWQGHAWRGKDSRGWSVGNGEVPALYDRIRSVMLWREKGVNVSWSKDDPTEGLWGGGGHKLIMNLPSQRYWLGGGLPKHRDWLKSRNQYMAKYPHGMDALLHLHSVARRIGLDIRHEPNKIYVHYDYRTGGAVR